MKKSLKKEHLAQESLDNIIKRIGPYMPKKHIGQVVAERRWNLIESGVCPPLFPKEHNQVTSPY